MNKALTKEIMTRTRLRNKFLNNRSEKYKKKYLKQRNYCVSLLRKSKSDYFGNLNEKNISGNKTWFPDNQMEANISKCHLPVHKKYEVAEIKNN